MPPKASRILVLIVLIVPLGLGVTTALASPVRPQTPPSALRVCADPNNLPFSNRAGAGFENRIAEMLAQELHRPVLYVWWAQRRGFVRSTLRAGRCDLIIGIPTTTDLVMPSRPYYRSSYVFVQRDAFRPRIRTFNDAALRRVRIGVQFIGDDYTNTPPAHALAARGIVNNVTGFSMYGNYARPNPTFAILEAVRHGTIDVAIVWGPLAGYFNHITNAPLHITAVSPQIDVPFLPFVFDISLGVRRNDPGLLNAINNILQRRQTTVDSILNRYGIPRVARAGR